jgi:hypothetical protein
MSEAIAEPAAAGDELSVGTRRRSPGRTSSARSRSPVADAAGGQPEWANSPQFKEAIASEADAIFNARWEQFMGEIQQGGGEPAQAEQGDGQINLDPFDDNFGQNLAQFLTTQQQQMLGQFQQTLSPVLQTYQQQNEEQGREVLKDAIGSVDVGGDFDRDAATQAFALFRDSAVEKYGVSNRALEHAAEQAARFVHQIESKAGQAAVERYKNELSAVGGAPRDAAAGTAGVSQQSFEGGDEMSIAARWGR